MRARARLALHGWQALVVAVLAVQLSSGLRVPRINHPDELWSLGAIQPSYGQLITFVLGQDNHPPLYYLLIKAWSAIAGNSIASVRLLSCLFGLLTLLVFALYLRRRRPLAFIAPLLLLATNPLFSYYSATVRPYALVVLLAAVALLSSLELRSGSSGPIEPSGFEPEPHSRLWLQAIFYGSCLLLGLTHYYGLLYALILLAVEILARRINASRLPAILVASLLCVWPLLQFFFGSLDKQIEANSWVNVVPFISTSNNALMGLFPSVLLSKQPLYLFSFLLTISLFSVALAPQLREAVRQWGWLRCFLHDDLAYLLGGLALIFAASVVADLRTPFSTPYYFLVGLPATALLFGACVGYGRTRFGAAFTMVFISAVALSQVLLAHARLMLA